MQNAPIPAQENERLTAVQSLNVLDSPNEERFDAITKQAIEWFKVPISTISIIDKDREWFKSCQGTATKQGDRSVSFCGHALLSKFIYIVEDTKLDPRFADNPQVVGEPYIRFYAGMALRDRATRQPVGVFCVKDTKPRKLTPNDITVFLDLANKAEEQLNLPPSYKIEKP